VPLLAQPCRDMSQAQLHLDGHALRDVQDRQDLTLQLRHPRQRPLAGQGFIDVLQDFRRLPVLVVLGAAIAPFCAATGASALPVHGPPPVSRKPLIRIYQARWNVTTKIFFQDLPPVSMLISRARAAQAATLPSTVHS